MKPIGQPFVIQNTDGTNWLVSCEDVVRTSNGERISFTVSIPKNPHLTLAEVEVYAAKRAAELIQNLIQQTAEE